VGGLRNTVSAGLQFIETDPNILWIGVRSDRNAAYYFGVAHSKQSCTYEINDEIITEFYFDNNYFSEEDEHLIRIVVEGELFSMTVDGQTICTFSDSALSYGKVTISAYPGTGAKPSYPWVEDILIMEK
jgi:aldehyde:ferredoxin oxidoreductase